MKNGKMIHVGIRPEYPLKHEESSYAVWIESLPDGGERYWNRKTLNSGCNKVVNVKKVKDDLTYCPHCDEMANINQFILDAEDE